MHGPLKHQTPCSTAPCPNPPAPLVACTYIHPAPPFIPVPNCARRPLARLACTPHSPSPTGLLNLGSRYTSLLPHAPARRAAALSKAACKLRLTSSLQPSQLATRARTLESARLHAASPADCRMAASASCASRANAAI